MGRPIQLAAACAVAFLAGSGAAAPQAQKSLPKLPPIETFTLANGLKVAVLATDTPVVAVQVWYRAGSKDEPRDRRGIARMFERMMFKGSTHVRTDAHTAYLSAVGGTTDAQADEDSTHFANTLPPDWLDLAIRLEADRMRNLLFRPDVITAERTEAKQLIAEQENAPLTRGLLRFLEVAYTKHPYAWTAIGNAKDLDAAAPADFKKFYDAYYQPSNALLVVTGKATIEAVKASAEKWFGPIPKAADPARPAAQAAEPAQTAKRREVIEPGPLGLTLIGFHIPPAKDKDVLALQLATILLGGNETARLKARLKTPDARTKRPLALEAGMEAVVREDPGMAIAVGAYRDPGQAAAVEAAMLEEIGKLATTGPTADELRRVKNQVETGFVFSLESARGLAQAIGRSWILVGDPTAFVRDLEAITKLTSADIARAVKKYMTPDAATIVVVPPKES